MRVNDQMPLRVTLAPIARIGCFYPLLDHKSNKPCARPTVALGHVWRDVNHFM
jgi:hypothetical protein